MLNSLCKKRSSSKPNLSFLQEVTLGSDCYLGDFLLLARNTWVLLRSFASLIWRSTRLRSFLASISSITSCLSLFYLSGDLDYSILFYALASTDFDLVSSLFCSISFKFLYRATSGCPFSSFNDSYTSFALPRSSAGSISNMSSLAKISLLTMVKRFCSSGYMAQVMMLLISFCMNFRCYWKFSCSSLKSSSMC